MAFRLLARPFYTSLRALNVSKPPTMSSNNTRFQLDNLFNVKDWVCVVTGAGTGIGLMATQALANNGAKVYMVGRRAEVLEQAVKTYGSNLAHPSGQMIPITADITSKESISQLVSEISKKEKHVNLLVNDAGISKATTEVEKGDESAKALSDALFNEPFEDWEDTYRTNVIGYFYMSTAFLPLLNAATESIPGFSAGVINISSISGITRTSQHHFSYNVSKAATIQLNTLLGQEFSRPGVRVRVNSIAPGIFPSQMTAGGADENTNKSHIDAEGYREKKLIPAGRPGREEDMAQAVLMLAVNQYMNGQTVVVDGGYLLGKP